MLTLKTLMNYSGVWSRDYSGIGHMIILVFGHVTLLISLLTHAEKVEVVHAYNSRTKTRISKHRLRFKKIMFFQIGFSVM